MKRMTASEARRNWFRLLDEVLAGEVIAIIRKGARIIIRRENARASPRRGLPDYRSILRAPDVQHADAWSWNWPGPEEDVSPVERKP